MAAYNVGVRGVLDSTELVLERAALSSGADMVKFSL
jgi:hypothetical protein